MAEATAASVSPLSVRGGRMMQLAGCRLNKIGSSLNRNDHQSNGSDAADADIESRALFDARSLSVRSAVATGYTVHVRRVVSC